MDDMFKTFEVAPKDLESVKESIQPHIEQLKEGLISLTELIYILEDYKVVVHWIQRVNPAIILTFILVNDQKQQSSTIFEERF